MVYGSTHRSLAALEVLVHMREPHGMALPLTQYLVEMAIPAAAWDACEEFDPDHHPGWDATPAGPGSVDWGTAWANECRSLIALVPSVIVPEERNVLINPLHPDAAEMRVAKLRPWNYDVRLGASART